MDEPEYVKRWWGPRGFTTIFCKIDLRVGGSFHYCMRSPQGKDYWNKETYLEVVVPERLVLTMHFSDANGNILLPTHYGMGEDFPSEMLDVVIFSTYENDKPSLSFVEITLYRSP